METIKRFISVNILLLFSILYSQSYTVSVLGYTIANIEITTKNSSEKRFELQSRGVADLLFPAKNNYLTNYDSSTFFLEKYNYDINQLDFDIVYDAQTDSSYNLIYNKKDTLFLENSVHNFFTLISILETKNTSSFDTKWFNYESIGELGRARFIWSDSTNIFVNNDSIMCDHYRLDIDIPDRENSLFEQVDYLSSYLDQNNQVKEIWVSKKKKKIILMKIKLSPFNIDIKIVENKRI